MNSSESEEAFERLNGHDPLVDIIDVNQTDMACRGRYFSGAGNKAKYSHDINVRASLEVKGQHGPMTAEQVSGLTCQQLPRGCTSSQN